jgi:hypothetical protein
LSLADTCSGIPKCNAGEYRKRPEKGVAKKSEGWGQERRNEAEFPRKRTSKRAHRKLAALPCSRGRISPSSRPWTPLLPSRIPFFYARIFWAQKKLKIPGPSLLMSGPGATKANDWAVATCSRTVCYRIPRTLTPPCGLLQRKINRYRQQYADNQNISFLPAIMTTSSRMHGEFLRLLFLQAHRETTAHFNATGLPPQQKRSDTAYVWPASCMRQLPLPRVVAPCNSWRHRERHE